MLCPISCDVMAVVTNVPSVIALCIYGLKYWHILTMSASFGIHFRQFRPRCYKLWSVSLCVSFSYYSTAHVYVVLMSWGGQ